jgi:hypothetical protein
MANHYALFSGGRDYDDAEWVAEVMQLLVWIYGDKLRVIHGAARGADTLVDQAAKALGVPVKSFPVTDEDWRNQGKAAGHIRNAAMAAYAEMCRAKGHTTQLLAFDGGAGTSGMMAECERRQISVDSL